MRLMTSGAGPGVIAKYGTLRLKVATIAMANAAMSAAPPGVPGWRPENCESFGG
jgi:hypothetical protein